MSQKRKAVIPISSRRRKVPRIDAMQAVLDDQSVLENIFSRVAPGDIASASGVSKTWESIILKTYGAVGLLMGIMKGATKDGQQLGYFRKYIRSITEPDALVNLASYACSKDYIIYLKAIMAQYVPLYGTKNAKTPAAKKYFLNTIVTLMHEYEHSGITREYLRKLYNESFKDVSLADLEAY